MTDQPSTPPNPAEPAGELPIHGETTVDATPSVQQPTRKPRSRRRCCGCLALAFGVLCLVAAVGNYLRHTRTGHNVQQRIVRQVREAAETVTGVPGAGLPPQPKPHALPENYQETMAILTPVMKKRFASDLEKLGVSWPPARVRVLALKAEREVELWVGNRGEATWKLLKTYPVLAASGTTGPKRRKGDRQVPEGIYRIAYHNPKSQYHLSLLLDYPNAADKTRESKALKEGLNLGGDICVHGSYVSSGCLAMGDGHIEEIFTITGLADRATCDVVILPADFRRVPEWVETLAAQDAEVLRLYQELSALANQL